MTEQGLLSLLPSQQQLLVRINHLATIDSGLSFISGPPGAGKYTLATALLEQFDVGFNQAWLNCRLRMSEQDCREELLRQLLPDAVFNAEEALEDILSQQTIPPGSRWLLTVTNAERLSNQLLVELWGLVERCRRQAPGQFQVSVLLFAESEWVDKVSAELESIAAQEPSIINVTPLPEDEQELLALRIINEHDDTLQLSDIAPALAKSRGWPGEIVQLVEQHGQPASEAKDETTGGRRFGLWLLVLVLVIGGTAGILWWSTQADEAPLATRRDGPPPFAETATEQTPHSTEAAATTPTSDDAHPDALAGDWQQPADATSDKASAATDPAMADAPVATANEPQPVANEATPQPAESKVDETEADVQAEQAEKETAAAEPEPAAEAPTLSPTQKIKAVPAAHYSLQLVVLSSEKAMKTFMRRNKLIGDSQFHYYVTQRNGKRVYIAFYGNYPKVNQARSAINALPKSLQSIGAWPRSYRSIQEELQTVVR